VANSRFDGLHNCRKNLDYSKWFNLVHEIVLIYVQQLMLKTNTLTLAIIGIAFVLRDKMPSVRSRAQEKFRNFDPVRRIRTSQKCFCTSLAVGLNRHF
jgi:hypothetical protein